MKKIIAILLCLVLLLGCLPIAACAECSGYDSMQHGLFKYRGYINSKLGYDTISDYYGKDVSGWARDATSWAYAVGLMNGSDENGTILLLPRSSATRAQMAMLIMNYCICILFDSIINPKERPLWSDSAAC